MSFKQAKREFTNGGEVESGVFLSRLAKVFAHDDVEHPVQVVLDAPMGACGRQNDRRHWPQRCDVESRFNGCRSGFFIRARRSYGGDAAKSDPVRVPFLEPCNVIRGAANALFNAPVAMIRRCGKIATFGKFRVGKEQLHVIVEGALVSFQSQKIIGFFAQNGLSDDFLCSHRVNRDDGSLQRQCFEK